MNPMSRLPLITGELGASTALRGAHQEVQPDCVARLSNLTTSKALNRYRITKVCASLSLFGCHERQDKSHSG